MPQFTFTRLQQFDNIELFASESENDYFPFHIHDIFCVSLITKGTEILKNTEQEFMAPAGSISITQANEMHRNYALEDIGYSYQTLYVNPELLKHFNNNRAVRSLERVIYDPRLFWRLSGVFSGCENNAEILPDCFRQLCSYAENRPETDAWQSKFYQIDDIVESHSDTPISSDWLARSFCMSKYHFIREFKRAKGVTPQTYITLYRLGKARKMLLQQVPVNDVAYYNGFYDASHFIHHFKRYYGITPAQYARSSGIAK
jgi:AraC-like DNA-binding protein